MSRITDKTINNLQIRLDLEADRVSKDFPLRRGDIEFLMCDVREALKARGLSEEHDGYWEEHPHYPPEDWMTEVDECDCRSSYWQWVLKQLKAEEEERE